MVLFVDFMVRLKYIIEFFLQQRPVYSPYLLKEYRNRWFLIAMPKKGSTLVILALDRIVEFMEMTPKDFKPHEGVNWERYYSDTIGVTKTQRDRAQKVILWVNRKNAPYVITKPIHHSQQVLKEDETGILIRIDVIINFELEREILGFGEFMKVMAPRTLQHNIQKRISKMNELYLSSLK